MRSAAQLEVTVLLDSLERTTSYKRAESTYTAHGGDEHVARAAVVWGPVAMMHCLVDQVGIVPVYEVVGEASKVGREGGVIRGRRRGRRDKREGVVGGVIRGKEEREA